MSLSYNWCDVEAAHGVACVSLREAEGSRPRGGDR
jgi:hypothetical protein